MEEYWNPYNSKWKAALETGLKVELKGDENILYLGASSGTTIGEISQKTKGTIFAVEKAFQMAIPLIKLTKFRKNIAPIFADARDIEYTKSHLHGEKIDILFQDIPSGDQVEILKQNTKLTQKNTKIYFTLKSQSISQENPTKVYQEIKKKLEKDFKIIDESSLEPFHKKHWFFILEKL
ncbi:MAG: fibrillarin-like pre-rRNA processing protein [Patescibacteria group bacterium]|jgi:fibrillarin-like pre-rRNA processing protein